MGKAKNSTGIARFIRRGGRLPQLHRRGPIEDSLRALATLQPRPEWSGMISHQPELGTPDEALGDEE